MGFLEAGVPLPWDDAAPYIPRVKRDGILQLLHIYRLNAERQDGAGELKWGDELEYTLVHLDYRNKISKVCVDAPDLLAQLGSREAAQQWDPKLIETANLLCGTNKPYLAGAEWHPEYGTHMIECTPSPPYENSLDSLLDIEYSMICRRLKVQSILPPNIFASSLAAFPGLGLPDYTMTAINPDSYAPKLAAGSRFMVDRITNPHPRFPTLTRNVNLRRGVKLCATMPVFMDHYTRDHPDLWKDSLDSAGWDTRGPFTGKADDAAATGPRLPSRKEVEERALSTANPLRHQIYMDHFGFGMGQSCLQVTFGCRSLNEARNLYDQLAVVAPLFLSLSAATPALRGLLADTDTRWRVLEQTCDCRTDEELEKLRRSRFGAVGTFLGNSDYFNNHEAFLNDAPLPVDLDALEMFHEYNRTAAGAGAAAADPSAGAEAPVAPAMDRRLCKHFASLWVRDPLVIFSDKIDLDNSRAVDHFENLQSTNWNAVRFKPPPPNGQEPSRIGWRVELRTPDIQLSDFANAALTGIAAVLAWAIQKEGWNLYIPISKNLENMDTAHKRESISRGLFWFPPRILGADGTSLLNAEEAYQEPTRMTLREIFLGTSQQGRNFSGILTHLDHFVSHQWRTQQCSAQAVEKYRLYANYIKSRVLGQSWTDAQLIRHVISAHPSYRHDSIVPQDVIYEVTRLSVLAGFSLCSQTSPWRITNCIPSSFRPPQPIDLKKILDLPLAPELLKVLHETSSLKSITQDPDADDRSNVHPAQKISDNNNANQGSTQESSHGQEKSHDESADTTTNTSPSSTTLAPAKRLKEKLEEEFDAVLFLELEQSSR